MEDHIAGAVSIPALHMDCVPPNCDRCQIVFESLDAKRVYFGVSFECHFVMEDVSIHP